MPPPSDLTSAFSLSSQTLLAGIVVLAAALLLVGWLGWRQRVRRQQVEGEANELRGQLQAQRAQAAEPVPAHETRDQLYRSLVANIPGAAFRCTPSDPSSVVFISDGIEALSGWAPSDYYASRSLLRALVHVDDQALVHKQVQTALAQGARYTIEYRALRRDGREIWIWEQGHAVRHASGEVAWLDGAVFDITQRKAMELALRGAKERADQGAAAKTVFLANMGHEVRTPLNAIIGFTELVLKTALDATQREHVYKTRQAALAMLKLVNDILDMAKLERGTLTLNLRDFSVQELALEALRAQRPAAEKKGLVLQLDADPSMAGWYRGDADRLRQVLDKLLDNAVKFTERGTVRLQLGVQDVQLRLTVHDTGIGMAPEFHDKVFEPFTQADPSMNRRYGGTGLGVTIAHQLVTRMGGSLTVTSEPGTGSSFRVLVPLAVAAAAGTQSGNSAQAPQLSQINEPIQPSPSGSLPLEHSTRASLHQAVKALRGGDHADATLPELIGLMQAQGMHSQAAELKEALAVFDLDRAAEVLETLPGSL
jgi:PAS domain S-box-containing protein